MEKRARTRNRGRIVGTFLTSVKLLLSLSLAFLNPTTTAFAQLQMDLNDTVNFSQGEMSTQTIRMIDNTSRVLAFERPIVRTAVGDVVVADVVAINQKEIMVVANAVGNTSLVVWEAGGINQTYQVFVEKDPHVLQDLIKARFPNSAVRVDALGDTFAMSGEVENSEERKEVMEIAERYSAGAVDMMSYKSPKQILIDVYFVELDRTDSKDYGYTWQSISKYINASSFAGNAAGQKFIDSDFSATKGAFTTDSLGLSEASQFNLDYIDGKTNLLSVLELLESKNFLRVIAKPKLLSKDGEEAKFLVGGRFPYATVQDGSTNVQFEEFGHELTFKPEILEDDVIRLTVDTKVSELNFTSTLTISGSTVPSIIENNAKTVVELRDEQTLVIGGFISKRTNDARTTVPFLGQIPFLGKIFRSDDLETREHELVFIITPHIISPLELEGAKKVGEFYDPKKIDGLLRIEELPDENYQADALRGALQNYQMNRIMAEQNTPAETMEPAPIHEAPIVKEEAMPVQLAPINESKEVNSKSDEPLVDSMLNEGNFKLDQALQNMAGENHPQDFPSATPPTVQGAAFENTGTGMPLELLGPAQMMERPDSSQSGLTSFQAFMKNYMKAGSQQETGAGTQAAVVGQDFTEVGPVLVKPAAFVAEMPAPNEMMVSEFAPLPELQNNVAAFESVRKTDSKTALDFAGLQNRGAEVDAESDYAIERNYKELPGHSAEEMQGAILEGQSASVTHDFSERYYRQIPSALNEPPVREEVMSAENIDRYNYGMRNFKLTSESWSQEEQLNFKREQEKVDRFFDDLDARRGL